MTFDLAAEKKAAQGRREDWPVKSYLPTAYAMSYDAAHSKAEAQLDAAFAEIERLREDNTTLLSLIKGDSPLKLEAAIADVYADAKAENAKLRKVVDAARSTANVGYDGTEPLEEALRELDAGEEG